MLFNSLEFILFFLIVVFSYYLLPHKLRWIMLLIASFYFYAYWNFSYLLLMILSILIVYYTSIKISETTSEIRKKQWLITNLVLNLGILFIFKYYNFFNDSIKFVLAKYFNIDYLMPNLNLLLPVGISFYTFQAIGYAIDVYRSKTPVEKHLGIFALFVSFFPQLVAGPIERSSHLLPQFYQKNQWDTERAINGLKLIAWGFFKKLVIADRVAPLVNQVYNNPTDHTGISFLIATYLFAFQIYCDFSAYSQIAIGSAQILGYDLMDNFKQPYLAKSVGEFWQKWHISLSTWFKDYVYIPLGGSRVSQPKFYSNLMIVFLISALWHGANWTFVIWGILHGIYIIGFHWSQNLRDKLDRFFQLHKFSQAQNILDLIITFNLVCLAWIFFRANTVTDAFYIFTHLFDHLNLGSIYLQNTRNFQELAASIVFIIFMLVIESKQDKFHLFKVNNIILRWSVYYCIIFGLIIFGMYEKSENFIYFQF